MAAARESAINAAGGINGRPIAITVCDDAFDPNKSADCARKAISENYTAVVGSVVVFPDVYKLFEDAGIPYVGGDGISSAEATSKISYPLGSVGNWYYGTAALLTEQGSKRPVVIACDDPSCTVSVDQLKAGMKLGGLSLAGETTYTLGAADFAPQATRAKELNPDYVVLVGPDIANVRLIAALRQAGYTGKVTALSSSLSQSGIKQLGAAANNVFLVSHVSIDPNGSAIEKQFYTEMKGETTSAQSAASWNALTFFTAVAKMAKGDLTRASLRDALDGVTTPIQPGLSGPWISPGKSAPPIANEPRLAKLGVRIYEIKDGALVNTSGAFFDPLTRL
jgi:ABC-type branched-subunit amino acid transport system substrate-binding protein